MNIIYKAIIFTFFLIFTEGVVAQTRFKATVLTGINYSQVSGDRQNGYRKSGLSLGLNGSIFIHPAFDISTELLYNQKGSKSPNHPAPEVNKTNISLNYGEVALLANFYLNPDRTNTYYTRSVHLGFSYGRLLNSSISVLNKATPIVLNNRKPPIALETEVANNLNPQDISFVIGWSQLFTPRLGITIRHTNALTFLYKDPTYNFVTNNAGFKYLRPNTLSFLMFYNLVSPNKVMGLRIKKKTGRKNPLEELY
jgi:hypothetical protein